MPRNKYDDAFGVARIRWQRGEPSRSEGAVLVEVWRPSLSVGEFTTAILPSVDVHSQIEARVSVNDRWYRLDWRGLTLIENHGNVRRWAKFPERRWSGTLTIDRWKKE